MDPEPNDLNCENLEARESARSQHPPYIAEACIVTNTILVVRFYNYGTIVPKTLVL